MKMYDNHFLPTLAYSRDLFLSPTAYKKPTAKNMRWLHPDEARDRLKFAGYEPDV